MEKKPAKQIRYFFMYFVRNGHQERSPEYRTYKEFYAACGEWCNAHPLDWKLCYRDAWE